MATPFDNEQGNLFPVGYLGINEPAYYLANATINLPADQALNVSYLTSTTQGVIQFSKDVSGNLFERLGCFNVETEPSVIANTLSLINDLDAWDSLNVGSLYISGDVTAGTEIVSKISNDGSGLLTVSGSIAPQSITDYVSSVGTSAQVLTAGAGGELLWADPGGGGFAYQAGIASIGEGGSVAVSFGTPFTGSVGAQGTYQPATGPPVLPLTLTASTTGLNIIGDVGSSVMWFAYNLNQ